MGDTNPISGLGAGVRLAGFISLAGIVAVNAMGVLDHDTESGLGCGAQWPLCHGALVPAFSNEAVIIEYVHRLLTMGFAIALIVFLVHALRQSRAGRPWKYMSWSLTVLLVIETVICTAGVLWTVPNAVMSWLMPVGLAAQALLWLMVRPGGALPSAARPLRRRALPVTLAALVLVGYLYVGAWISYAGPHGLAPGLMMAAGIVLALMGLVWIAGDWWSGVAMAKMVWPLLAAPFVTRFSRTTMLGDLAVYLWLSWLTGVFAMRLMGGLGTSGLGVPARQSVRDASSA